MNIYQRICNIIDEMPPFHKDGRNDAQRYGFVSVYQMYNVLRGLMAKHGVVCFPSGVVDSKMEIIRTTNTYNGNTKEKTQFYESQTVQYTFACGAGEDESFTVTVRGGASDFSDKAQNQAMTSAHKNALKQVFQIADEDPDAKSPFVGQDVQKPSQADQAVAEMLKCRSLPEDQAMKQAAAVWSKYKDLQANDSFKVAKEMVKKHFNKQAA